MLTDIYAAQLTLIITNIMFYQDSKVKVPESALSHHTRNGVQHLHVSLTAQ